MSESTIVGGVDLGASDAVRALAESIESILDGYQEYKYRWEDRGRKIERQRRELTRLNRDHLRDAAIIDGQNAGLAALETANECLYARIRTLETQLGYQTPEQTAKHAPNRHSLLPRTGAQSQGGKLHQCDSQGAQDATRGLNVEEIYWVALRPILDSPDTGINPEEWLIPILDAVIPEIRSQLAALIRARIDEDAAGKIHNDPATFNRGIGINIGLERAAQTVEGRQR